MFLPCTLHYSGVSSDNTVTVKKQALEMVNFTIYFWPSDFTLGS